MRSPISAFGLCSLLALGGCAPDAWQSVRATGFNEYLDLVQSQCQPLWLGQDLVRRIDSSNMPAGSFDQFMDLASQLYYGRIAPAAFSNALQASWPGERTANSASCMVAKLPSQRPSAPTGTALEPIPGTNLQNEILQKIQQ